MTTNNQQPAESPEDARWEEFLRTHPHLDDRRPEYIGGAPSPPSEGVPAVPSPAPGEVPTQDRPDSEIMQWIQQQSEPQRPQTPEEFTRQVGADPTRLKETPFHKGPARRPLETTYKESRKTEQAVAELLREVGLGIVAPAQIDPNKPFGQLLAGELGIGDLRPDRLRASLLEAHQERGGLDQFATEAAFSPLNFVPGLGGPRLVKGMSGVRFGLPSRRAPGLASQADVAFAVPGAPGTVPVAAAPVPVPPSQGTFEVIVVDSKFPEGVRSTLRNNQQARRWFSQSHEGREILPGTANRDEIFAARERLGLGDVSDTSRPVIGGTRRPMVESQQLPQMENELSELRTQITNLQPMSKGEPFDGPIHSRIRDLESQAAGINTQLKAIKMSFRARPETSPITAEGKLARPFEEVPQLDHRLAKQEGIPSAVAPRIPITSSADNAGSPEHIVHLSGQSGDTPLPSGDIPEGLMQKMGGAPPDPPPEVLARQASFPEGKARLSDPADFAEQIGVSTVRNRAARLARGLTTPREGPVIGENLSRTALNVVERAIRNPVVRGILRWTPALRNPSLFAEGPVQQAGLVRAADIDDGRQKITGLMAHARQFGNQDDLFGRTLRDTGLLDQGRFKGFSVNEIAENPSKFNLNSQQRRWIDEMNTLEKDLLDFRRRNGETVDEIRLGDDVERYAGRVHLARILDDGTIIERASIGPQRRAATATKHRTFKTMAEARKERYVPLSYEQSFGARAQSAYNRAVNKRADKWVMDNLPPDIEVRPRKPGEPIKFGETIDDQLPSFRGKVIGGAGDVNQFIEDLNGMFPSTRKPGPIVSIAKAVNQFNLLQRMFSLAGDASIATIQFKMLMDRHPVLFGRAVGEFTRTLVGSMLNPAANRARRAKKLADNAELIQNSPGLIMPDPGGQGLEFMESLGHGGFLGPEGLYGGQNKILKVAGRAPGTAAGILRPFQQALEAAMEDAGINLMKSQMHKVKGDPTKLRGVVDYVNNMRGLSSSARLGLTPNQRLSESMILLAPRYRRAIASLHADVVQGGLRGGMARQAYASLFAGTAATYTAFSYALGAAQGKSEKQIREQVIRGLNPANREFLLWKVGGSALGVGSKMVSDMRLLAKAASDPGELGDFTDFNRNTGVRWVRSQLAAGPSDGWDWLIGENYLGEPITRDIFGQPKETLKSLGKTLGEDVTFLWLQAAAFEGGTREDRILKGSADFFGARAYPYPGPTYDDVAHDLFLGGKDFDELAPPGSKYHTPDQLKVIEKWEEIIGPERQRQREERSEKMKTQREEVQEGIRIDPNWQQNLYETQQRYR